MIDATQEQYQTTTINVHLLKENACNQTMHAHALNKGNVRYVFSLLHDLF